MLVTGRRRSALVAAVGAGVFLTACAGREPQGDWVWAGMMELPQAVEAGQLPDSDSNGARLAGQYCSQCHGVPTPQRHSAEDWVPTLRRMFARMEHMSGMGPMRGMMGRGGGMMGGRRRGGGRMPMGMHGVEAPTAEERRAIVEYYRSHALLAVDPAALPAGDGKGAALFRDRCSQCHALPDPARYASEEWPRVVERMRANMERMGVDGLSDAETDAVVGYLQGASVRE